MEIGFNDNFFDGCHGKQRGLFAGGGLLGGEVRESPEAARLQRRGVQRGPRRGEGRVLA